MGFILVYFPASWVATGETTQTNLRKEIGFNLLHHQFLTSSFFSADTYLFVKCARAQSV